ncbi:MAG TPA: hypothetical protein PLI34_09290, partial [Saprospiraceae bacterium]|nr:hypothetical protein [Saprospiraceae bacterium]
MILFSSPVVLTGCFQHAKQGIFYDCTKFGAAFFVFWGKTFILVTQIYILRLPKLRKKLFLQPSMTEAT